MSNIPKQLIPLFILFALGIAAFIAARQLFVPASFGELGFYRADALKEASEIKIKYAGAEVCTDCHPEIKDKKAASFHRKVPCEACHGPAASHVEAPDENLPFKPKGRDFCPVCHNYNPSRPTGFPQILKDQHNPGKPCMTCHDPHDPRPPHTPEECSACHRSIANQKLVSDHTNLPCTQCHNVPAGHKANPRRIHAEKPADSKTCAACHDKNATVSSEIPRVEIEAHTKRNLCWECHYPHDPEGK